MGCHDPSSSHNSAHDGWDYRGTMLNEIDMRKMSTPLALAVLPDKRLVVGCDDESVFVWDLDTWELLLTLVPGKRNFSLLGLRKLKPCFSLGIKYFFL